MAVIRLPTPLRPMAGGADEVTVSGSSVREALDELDSQHQGLKSRICDEAGELRRFINLYVGEEDIRSLDGLDTALGDRDVLSIVPAIAGGRTTKTTDEHR